MRLRISGDPECFYHGNAAKLHVEDFDTPAPPSCTAYLRKLLHRLSFPNGVPVTLGECSADLPGASVRDCILEVGTLQQRFSYIIDFPCHDGVEPYRLTIRSGRRETNKMLSPRRNMFVPDLIDMKGPYPVKTWVHLPLELTEACKDPCLKWLDDHKEEQRLSEPLNDFEDAVEQVPISLYYPWG